MGKLLVGVLAASACLPGCWTAEEEPHCRETACYSALSVLFRPGLTMPGTYEIVLATQQRTYRCGAVIESVQSVSTAGAGGCGGEGGWSGATAGGGEAGLGCGAPPEMRAMRLAGSDCPGAEVGLAVSTASIDGIGCAPPLPENVTVSVYREGEELATETFVPEYSVSDPACFPGCEEAGVELAVGP
jgi:hypothetical protein